MRLLNIGFGNLLNSERILAALHPDSQPVKRMVQESKAAGTLIDATHGRRTQTVLCLDSGHIVLSYLPPEKLEARLAQDSTAVTEI
jgi:regulator of extracellular matrix RemA (YlzA/DUF370 family)